MVFFPDILIGKEPDCYSGVYSFEANSGSQLNSCERAMDDDVKRIFEEILSKLDFKQMLMDLMLENYVIGRYQPEVNEKGEVLGFMGVPK